MCRSATLLSRQALSSRQPTGPLGRPAVSSAGAAAKSADVPLGQG